MTRSVHEADWELLVVASWFLRWFECF